LKTTTPTRDECDDREGEQPEAVAEKSSPARERKKRKRSAATDEIDELFDDAIGRKVVRSALPMDNLVPPSPAPTLPKSKKREGSSKERVKRDADLGAVVDAIRVAPSGEEKKRSKRKGA
jgi:hypothetical protein